MIEKPVKMYTDWGTDPNELKPGHFIQSEGPRARACYLVQTIRMSKTIPSRIHWTGVRWPREEVPDGATIHWMRWYSRNKKGRR